MHNLLGPALEHWWIRISDNLRARLDGPLHLRFILQPLMAILLAIRDGLRDARNGGRAYLWLIVTNGVQRPRLLLSGWKAIGRVFVLALAVDVVYQIIAFKKFYPMAALITAALLAIVPYIFVRGPINRIQRILLRKRRISHPFTEQRR